MTKAAYMVTSGKGGGSSTLLWIAAWSLNHASKRRMEGSGVVQQRRQTYCYIRQRWSVRLIPCVQQLRSI